MKDRNNVGIGLVGYGYWGPKLARNFSATNGCRLQWVCELDAEKAQQAATVYPSVSVTSDYEDLLNDETIHAIVIATPVTTHFDLAKKALMANKDVLIEKPMTQTSVQAIELLKLAEQRELILAVDHTFLYTGAVSKIKELVDRGELGKLMYIDSVRVNLGLFQQDINVLFDLAPHEISMVLYLLEEEPIFVQAMGSSHINPDFEHLVYLHMEYASGFMAHFHLSWLAPVKIRKTLIAGMNKMVVYDDLEPSEKVKVYDKGVSLHTDPKYFNKIRIDYRTGDMVAPKLFHLEALLVEADHFVQSIVNRQPMISDGILGLRVIKIMEAAQSSLSNQGAKINLGDLP